MNQPKGANQPGTKAAGKKETLIEEGTTLKGAIDSDCSIVVKGGLEGEISGPALHVSSTGFVSGTVSVGEIHSEGELSGEFEADTVQLSGRVKDKTVIRARSLDVKLAPDKGKMELVFGECELDVGEVAAKEEAVSAASAADDAAPAKAAEAGAKAGEAGKKKDEEKAAKAKKGQEKDEEDEAAAQPPPS